MLSYYLVALSAVFLTSICQVLLKVGAMKGDRHQHWIWSYLNPYTVSGYFLLLVATVLSAYAYRYISLKSAMFLLPCGFVAVALLSHYFLNERFSRRQILASGTILVGIVIFNL